MHRTGRDFTVGARYIVGQMLGEATIGRFGGLAVFNRSLSDAEMMRFHGAAAIERLNQAEAASVPAVGRNATEEPAH